MIDGADLPVVNMVPLKAYDVAKHYALTFHNYGPSIAVMNVGVWNGLTPAQQKLVQDVSMEAQARSRKQTEDVDSLASAKKLLEPHGMTVTGPDIAPFRKIAQEKVWPTYQKQYPELWEQIVGTPA